MLILLDCRPLQLAGSDSEKNRLIVSAVAGLSGDKGVEWLFLVDHTYRPGGLPGLRGLDGLFADLPGSRLLTARGLPGPLGWKLWYDWQLPRLVKRYKPDVVMLTGGVIARPVPARQYLWMPTVPIPTARWANSLRHAEMIFCFSERDRAWLAARGAIDAGNILVVRPSVESGISPLAVDQKEAIKQRYTGGKEYFFTGAAGVGEEEVVQLLKAFSLFKKRQLSNLQLVIAGVRTETLRLRLETYKYRQDVHWVDRNVGDLRAAAYAVLLPFEDDSPGVSLLNAWKAGVPAVIARNSRFHEMADDAVLTAGIDDPAALAGCMMSLYKDEMLRNTLIEKGSARLTAFDPASSLTAIRTAIGN
jgi:glycosyltransferase involved in cell wall biosynthesis